MTSWFFDRMQGFGAADAIVFNGTTYSYADLVARVEQWTRTLDEQGVAADEVVALEGATSIAACAGLLALVARGAVVVPLAPLPEAKRTEFHEVAEVERVITLDPATQLPSITTTGRRADNEFYRTLRARRTPGLVLFSSGTTGRSKATVLDFAALLANVRAPHPAPAHRRLPQPGPHRRNQHPAAHPQPGRGPDHPGHPQPRRRLRGRRPVRHRSAAHHPDVPQHDAHLRLPPAP